MSTHVVEDPEGRTWRVGVPLLPWRPRWRGPRPWRAWTGNGTTSDEEPRRARRRHEVGDLAGEALGQGIVELPLQVAAETLGEGLAPLLLALLLALVVAVVLFGGLFLAVELLVALVLSLGAVALRIVLRRPWLVVAVTDDERRTWPVVGLAAARSHAAAVADALARGGRQGP